MKNKRDHRLLPPAVAALGVIALVLRKWLYIVGPDGRHLLPVWHPLEIALWAVTGLTILLVMLSLRKVETLRGYGRNYPNPMVSALGTLVMTLGLGVTVGLFWKTGAAVDRILGLLSTVALGYLAICRIQRKQPNWMFHGLVCLFFAVHLVGRYQTWSGCPQMEDYVFTMLSCVAMMLFAYQQAAFDAGCGNRRSQLRTGLLTGFFCLTALSHTEDFLLYASGAVWGFTGLCTTAADDRREV